MIGTVGTIGSGAYQHAVAALAPGVELTCAACPGFVEFVERGETRSDQVTVLAERLLAPVRDAKVDALLLGCTHYPFLARTISDVMGRDVVLVDSADETAFEVRAPARRLALARGADAGPATHRWLSSGDVDRFRRLGRRLLGPELDAAEPVTWPGDAGSADGRRRLRGCGHDHAPARRPPARRAPPDHLRAGLHDDVGGVVPGDLRRHAGALHGVDRRGRPPLDAGQRQGLGHRRVLDAARAARPSASAAR